MYYVMDNKANIVVADMDKKRLIASLPYINDGAYTEGDIKEGNVYNAPEPCLVGTNTFARVRGAELKCLRNQYLADTDVYCSVVDFPISADMKDKYIAYREYLRHFPEGDEWWCKHLDTFEEWCISKGS